MELPQPTPAALQAYRELHSELTQWAPTLHRLVWARIAALEEAHGPLNHPTETDEEYAMRVLAHGQTPFPRGASLYDGPSNIGYDHVEVRYGIPSLDGAARITFTGHFPEWAPDGQSFKMLRAEIHCPSWLVTDADGIERFEAQTESMVAAVLTERAEQSARIGEIVDRMLAEPPAAG